MDPWVYIVVGLLILAFVVRPAGRRHDGLVPRQMMRRAAVRPSTDSAQRSR